MEVEVEEGDTTAEAEKRGASTMEGTDAGLTGAVVADGWRSMMETEGAGARSM